MRGAKRALLAVALGCLAAMPASAAAPPVAGSLAETRTGSLLFGVGVNCDTGLTGSIILNERNFDIRPATSVDVGLSDF